MTDREQQLRERAYQLWQAEGEPHGRDREHWQEAERSLDPVEQSEVATSSASDQPVSDQAATGETADETAAPQTTEAETTEAVAAPDQGLSVSEPAGVATSAKRAAKPRAPRGKGKPSTR